MTNTSHQENIVHTTGMVWGQDNEGVAMSTIALSLEGAGQSTVVWYTYNCCMSTNEWRESCFYFFYDRYPIQEHCYQDNMCYIAHLGFIMSGSKKECQISLADE